MCFCDCDHQYCELTLVSLEAGGRLCPQGSPAIRKWNVLDQSFIEHMGLTFWKQIKVNCPATGFPRLLQKPSPSQCHPGRVLFDIGMESLFLYRSIFFNLFIYLSIYLSLYLWLLPIAARGLSLVAARGVGLLFIAVRGFVIMVSSPVADHGL